VNGPRGTHYEDCECRFCGPKREQKGDPDWLKAHAELVQVHEEKSGGYGTGDDPLANYVAVGVSNGRAPFMYALDRITEKITRCQSLYQQGRVAELEEEFKDMASLALCAEALRRRE
jgi:hypothetical protein